MAWSYDFSELPGVRLHERKRTCFQDVVDDIERCISAEKHRNVLCCHASAVLGKTCNCSEKEGVYRRVEYCISVGSELFDDFFNSSFGYRASYFDSPQKGKDDNALLMKAIAPSLVSYTKENALDVVKNLGSIAFIERSLSSDSAKVWLAENGNCHCKNCTGEWSTGGGPDYPEIKNNRWEHVKNEDCESKWGDGRAPYLTKLRIFGAFLNVTNTRDQCVTKKKEKRAEHINRCGWS